MAEKFQFFDNLCGQRSVEGEDHLPVPAGHPPCYANLDAIWAAGGYYQLVSQLSSSSNPKHFSARLLSLHQSLSKLGIALTHVQELALGLLELHEAHMGALLQLVHISLNIIHALSPVNSAWCQLQICCRCA